jgi:Sulfotransferase family
MSDERWPNLFIVGAAKAGTTSLYHYLARHPDVYMSPVKEPHFFSQIRPTPNLEPFFPHVVDEAAYLALFAAARGEKYLGEASTSYLWDHSAADAIQASCPDAKIIIILREPCDRAYSHYWNDVREGIEHRSFDDAVSEEVRGPPGEWGVSSLYVDAGFYSERVERYLEKFEGNVLILFFEQLVADVPTTVEQVFTFLAVDPGCASQIEREASNPFALPRNALSGRLLGSGALRSFARIVVPRPARAYGRKLLTTRAEKPQMAADVRQRLLAIYESDVRRLTEVTGRQPPWPAFGGDRSGNQSGPESVR